MIKRVEESPNQLDRVKEKEKYGLEFFPNQETMDACAEITDMINGDLPKKVYHSFDDMWSDICES